MAVQRIADMTIDELEGLIEKIVDQRIKLYPKPAEPLDKNRLRETLNSIRQRCWTPL